MNTAVPGFVRSLMTGLLLAAGGEAFAQEGSLTKDFPKLTAKERSRIAAKETEEAAADQAYQTRMQEAERAFQDKRYEDALAAYEQARELRPYNVYPKVKIQDLKALLKRQAEAAPATTAAAEPAPQPPSAPAEPPPAAPPVVERPAAPPVQSPPAKPVEHPAVGGSSRSQVHPPRSEPERPPEPPPIAMEERTYREGNAIVVERAVDDGGQRVVYKRVSHTWGQVFYFKDGRSVDERIWKDRFNER
ncbi:MAG: hypothetical protein JST66_09875 [Bacteroidetes bacterium]|nr:hypothetical protein [Bacteroidota bacterium]